MSSTGERLAEARLQKGKSLADVERAIKVRVKYLEALENDDYSVIPGTAYARGFLKNYAEYLGLDAKELLRQYSAEHSEPPPSSHLPEPIRHLERDHIHVPRRTWLWVGVVIGAALLLWIGAGLVGAARTPQGKGTAGGATGATAPASRSSKYKPPRGKTEVGVAPAGDARPYVEVTVNGRLAFQGQLDRMRRYLGAKVRIRTSGPQNVRIEQDRRAIVMPTGGASDYYERTFVAR